jgi:pimeloyl-ACP methyl ester carboxylesterase
MTLASTQATVTRWNEHEGVTARGTLFVLPGRGEEPSLYQRFGRRLSADAYRVLVLPDPTSAPAPVRARLSELLASTDTVSPKVLVGSDTGALYATWLLASGELSGIDALILAGLPTRSDPGWPTATPGSWEDELAARTSCPAHRGVLANSAVRRGALFAGLPEDWLEQADLSRVKQPVLGIHGADDEISPLPAARLTYAAAPAARLVSVAGGKHDALNDLTHRSVAATMVQFLERLRLGAELPVILADESLEGQ